MIGKYFRWKPVLKPKQGYSSCFVGWRFFSKRKSCMLPGFLSSIPNVLLRSNNFFWGCWAPSVEPIGGEWAQGYSRSRRSYPSFLSALMCLLITALMKYLQLIMIWSNWNPFRKDKWNCYYWWMLCDSGEIGMAVWASHGSYYIGWIISVIAAFWFVVPESCLTGVCQELYLSAVTAQILLLVHPLLNLMSIFSNCPPRIPCLSLSAAECLGHAGSASVPLCTVCSALSLVCTRNPSPLPSLRCQQKHWPEGSSHLPWLPQPVFLFRNNQGHMILIQRRICSISLLWFRHLGGKEKKECDPWRRYRWRCVRLEFG